MRRLSGTCLIYSPTHGPFVNDESLSVIQSYTFALLVSGGSDAGNAAGGL